MRIVWTWIAIVIGFAGCREPDNQPSSSGMAAGDAFVREWRVIVPVAYAVGVAGPNCGRAGPRNVESYWEPAEAAVAEIDAKLAVLLDSALVRGNPGATSSRRASEYYRQYVGIISSGLHLIYVNGFHQRQAAAVRSDGEGGDENDASYWRTHAIMGCDGGKDFFGVTYDPAAGTFSHIEFNDSL